jgi:hypothetical protein
MDYIPLINDNVLLPIVPLKPVEMSFDQAQLICTGVISVPELIYMFGEELAALKYAEAGRVYAKYLKRKLIEDKIPIEVKQSPKFNINGYINEDNDMEVM